MSLEEIKDGSVIDGSNGGEREREGKEGERGGEEMGGSRG